MIPTRIDIQAEIDKLKPDSISQIYDGVSVWLGTLECPDKDKQMILDDINSYDLT